MADGKIIQVGDSRFQVINTLGDLESFRDEDGFVLGKNDAMLKRYKHYFESVKAANIFEIGIKHGGSAAFFYETFKPARLATIDIGEPAPMLERWIEERGLREVVRTFYGVDQADVPRMRSICEEVFGDQPIDLVIDDASHLLDETRASFNAIFPYVRPGGAFVIEDWVVLECFRGWEGALPPEFKGTRPMSDLIKDIVVASGIAPKVVDEVITNMAFTLVRRGPAELGPDFDIRAYA